MSHTRARHKRHSTDLAQSISTREVTSKDTNLCLIAGSPPSLQAPPEETLLPPLHSVILILAFCLLRLLHSPFSLKLVRRCCGIKWYTWYVILCLKSGHKSFITYKVLKSHRCIYIYIYIYIYTLNYIKYSHMHNIYIGEVRKYMYI